MKSLQERIAEKRAGQGTSRKAIVVNNNAKLMNVLLGMSMLDICVALNIQPFELANGKTVRLGYVEAKDGAKRGFLVTAGDDLAGDLAEFSGKKIVIPFSRPVGKLIEEGDMSLDDALELEGRATTVKYHTDADTKERKRVDFADWAKFNEAELEVVPSWTLGLAGGGFAESDDTIESEVAESEAAVKND